MKQYAVDAQRSGYLGNIKIPDVLHFQWVVPGAAAGAPVYITTDESKVVTTRGAVADGGLPGEDSQEIVCINAATGATIWNVKLGAEAGTSGSFVIGLDADDGVLAARSCYYQDAKLRKLSIVDGSQDWATTDPYYFRWRHTHQPIITPRGVLLTKQTTERRIDLIETAGGTAVWQKVIPEVRELDWAANCYAAEYDCLFQTVGRDIFGYDALSGDEITRIENVIDTTFGIYARAALSWDSKWVDPEKSRRVGQLAVAASYWNPDPEDSRIYFYGFERGAMKPVKYIRGHLANAYDACPLFITKQTSGGFFRVDPYIFQTSAKLAILDGNGEHFDYLSQPFEHWSTISHFQVLSSSWTDVLMIHRAGLSGFMEKYTYFNISSERPRPRVDWTMPFGTADSRFSQPAVDSSSSLYINVGGNLYKFGTAPTGGSQRERDSTITP